MAVMLPAMAWGQAMGFNGGALSTGVVIANESRFHQTALSIAGCIKFTQTNTLGTLASKGTASSSANGWWVECNNAISGSIGIQIYIASSRYRITRSSSMPTGWHHFVATWSDGDNYPHVYTDGVLNDYTNMTLGALGNIGQNTYRIILGNCSVNNIPLTGNIGYLFIYNRVLTQNEIISIANSYPYGSFIPISGLVGGWTGNKILQTGSTLPSGTLIYDVAGGENNGIATNVASAASIIGTRGGIIK